MPVNRPWLQRPVNPLQQLQQSQQQTLVGQVPGQLGSASQHYQQSQAAPAPRPMQPPLLSRFTFSQPCAQAQFSSQLLQRGSAHHAPLAGTASAANDIARHHARFLSQAAQSQPAAPGSRSVLAWSQPSQQPPFEEGMGVADNIAMEDDGSAPYAVEAFHLSQEIWPSQTAAKLLSEINRKAMAVDDPALAELRCNGRAWWEGARAGWAGRAVGGGPQGAPAPTNCTRAIHKHPQGPCHASSSVLCSNKLEGVGAAQEQLAGAVTAVQGALATQDGKLGKVEGTCTQLLQVMLLSTMQGAMGGTSQLCAGWVGGHCP